MKNIYDLFTFGLQRRHMRTKMQEKGHSYYYLYLIIKLIYVQTTH